MISLECLFSNNLKHLFLDNNKISDLTIFNKRQIFNNLEVLNLSYNNITNISPLVNTQFSKLKKLNLIGNQLKLGIESFISNKVKNVSEGLILEINTNNNNTEILFEYSVQLEIKFTYIIDDKNYNDVLKNILFNGIKSLKLKGFNNDIKFLSNQSLQSLKKLDIVINNINDLSIFNNINFINLYEINIYSIDGEGKERIIIPTIEKNFDSLTVFKSIRAENIIINFKDNKYEFKVDFISPRFHIYFYNIDFLYSNALLNTEKITIQNSIFDNDGKSTKFFSYETLKNRKLSCFKRIYSYNIYIKKENNKYICYITFYSSYLSLNFNFDDLSFLENNNGILFSTRYMRLYNLTLKTLKNYNSLYDIDLNNIYIDDIEIISKLYNVKTRCQNVKCNPNLIDSLENYNFEKKDISKRNKLYKK